MTRLFNTDCNFLLADAWKADAFRFDAVYADVIYESTDFHWAGVTYELMNDNAVMYVQTDYHTSAQWKLYLDRLFGKQNFINWIITVQEWGGTSKRFFPRKHDDILMYAKGKDYKFYPERVQIPKVTAGTKLDAKGTGLKTPCDVFYDLGNFSTISKERVKGENGKNIQWQKSLKLIDRLLRVCTDEGDQVFDPFMGSGTSGVWCVRNSRAYVGVEKDRKVFAIAESRINSG